MLVACSRDEEKRSISEHFQHVRDELSAIENLTDLVVEGTEGQYGSIVTFEDDGSYDYPNTYWVRIAFGLYIPLKVQERLNAPCGIEKISVLIVNHYHAPVCYVYSSEGLENFDPSTGIMLVRRYLEEKLKGSALKFGSIGPSPFHARFWTTGGEKERLILVGREPGYKDYVFTYDKSSTSGLTEFTDRYGDEFSLFYYLHNVRRASLHLQSAILTESRRLIENPAAEGCGKAHSLIRAGTSIDQLNRDVMSDQLYRKEMTSLILERGESEPTESFDDIEYHFRELTRFSKEEQHTVAKDVIRTMEARRQSFFQNVSVLVSGLFGGIIGALLGSMLTYVLTS